MAINSRAKFKSLESDVKYLGIISHFMVKVGLLITYPEPLLITDFKKVHRFL